jgi:hypothetical protein
VISANVCSVSVIEEHIDVVDAVFSRRVVYTERTLDGLLDDLTVGGEG